MAGNAFLAAFVLLSVIAGSFAQDGLPCHQDIFQMTPRHSLNITKFMGTWYAQEYAGSHIGNVPAPSYKCLAVDFSLPDPSNILKFNAGESYIELETGLSKTDMSYITVNDTRSPLSSVWKLENEDASITASQILLYADLEFGEWCVVYSCQIRGETAYRWETVTIFTRAQQITEELRQTVKALTVGFGFRIGDHQRISQEECA